MIKQVPNIITSLNLLCGCVAILFAVSGDLITASLFVIFGIFFDFFDGLAARLLKAHSDVGLQLDSLADMVTSGVAPAIVLVQLLHESLFGGPIVLTEIFSSEGWNIGMSHYFPFIGLLVAVASAYRLAKFNVDTRQTSSFIGLPTPANTILILSLPLILHFQYSEGLAAIILNKWFLIGFTLLSCILLNAEIPLFALKFKTWDFKSNALRYVFLLLSVVLIVIFHFLAIPLIILSYILLSLFWKD
ncbi:CDP-alcohol phosphatidyltransferase family protein [Ulvibacter litoralis]|uniref:CDP-diacylglycerol---serine O-phosphatidyltransferase n=1 Tax=Ulvibacter litoralis TaxID=227084 RepID=A0A1G7GWZ4_9FLAO|nr:CDP-alcohol phosphatidyltransferase family protein [Ulvibacter litoralis]GHC59833.1 phosphatidylserine synthase [Ulvibacter litoralis]SDE92594.1 CDP-diacylglycerol---serine O-phosphatidyltransferase [Ulvibacter litoralis]